jgi:hypothetical protein
MAMEDKIEKIRKVSRKEGAAQKFEPQEELQRVAPNKERFDNLVQQQAQQPEKIAEDRKFDPSKKTSLMDEVRELNSKTDKPTKVTPTELIAQTEQAINRIDDLKAQLQTPAATIKESAVPLLRNKLTHIDESIRVALSKAGSEFSEAVPSVTPVGPKENPMARFLGMLTDGQSKLESLAGEVERMALNGHDINPATMILVQIKVGYIQQELEFFAGLLNKALESTKTIMNVQV